MKYAEIPSRRFKNLMASPKAVRKTSLAVIPLVAVAVFFFFSNRASAADKMWVGPVNGNWSDANNWNPVGVPGSSDRPIFDGGNSAIIDAAGPQGANISVQGIQINVGYTGTIAQADGVTLTVGSSGFTQNGGTFIGSSGNIDINGTSLGFQQSGGTFTASSNTTFVERFRRTGGAFLHNGGTVILDGSVGVDHSLTGVTFNNLTCNKTGGAISFLNGTPTVAGTLTLSDGFVNSGTITAQGNVAIAGTFDGGNAGLSFTDTVVPVDQTFINNGGANLTGTWTINKPSGKKVILASNLILSQSLTITFGELDQGASFNLTAGAITVVANGIFTGGSGSIDINGQLTLNGGTFKASSNTSFIERLTRTSGNFTSNGGTVILDGSVSVDHSLNAVTFNNLTCNKTGGAISFLNGTPTVAGTLTLSDGFVNSGAITAQGNVAIAGTFDGGNAGLSFTDTVVPVDQTFINNGGANPTGTWTINKPSGKKVTLASNLILSNNQALNITAGTLDQGASFNVQTSNTLTIGANGVLRNFGTGDLTLGGNLSNAGIVNLNGGGTGCGDPNGSDHILISSSSGGTARNWSGAGIFSIVDVDVQDQNATGVSGGSITAFGASNLISNTPGWIANSGCPVEVTTQPTNQSVCPGASASFTAAASGTGLSFQWRKNGGNLSNGGNISGATSAMLTINPVGPADAASYDVVVTNTFGVTATSGAATLTVFLPTAITMNPGNISVCEGATASFMAAADGNPTPTVQWQESTDGGANFSNIGGATSTTLSFTTTASQNGNKYRAVFTNLCNSATTAPATLTVNTAPAISASPGDTTVCEGATASFTGAANGSPTPNVQWQVSTDGGMAFTDIPGETSTTLSFTTTASQNGNKYRAVFTNLCNSATTISATLTVNTAPVISASPEDATVCDGSTASFTATASGDPTPTVQWQLSTDGGTTFADIAGETSTTLSFTTTVSQNGNKYRAVFTNLCNTVNTTATLTVNGFALSSTSQFFPPGGGNGSVNILTAASCSWTAVSNDGFIHITAGGSGTGDGTVNFTVDPDFPFVPRSGTMTIAGLTFTIHQTNPTAITEVSFAAFGFDSGVLLEWKTGSEADNLGFNIYRDEAGRRTLVNRQIIAGSALRVGAALGAGASYAWWDSGIADCGSPIADCQNAAYWLEDIDLSGKSTWHGPFYAKHVDGAPPGRSQSALLSMVGAQAHDATTQPVETIAKYNTGSSAAAFAASAQLSKKHGSVAFEGAVKVAVKHEAWHRITQPELAAAGFNTRVDPRLLQLIVDGRELAIQVQGEQDGSFDPEDAVEFYGIGLDSPFTDARVYWLVAGNGYGRRIRETKGEGAASDSLSFTQTLERRDRTVYFSALLNGDRENFFGAVVAGNPIEQTLTLSHVATTDSRDATIEVGLQGVTLTPHRVNVEFNGVHNGMLVFSGQSQGVARFTVPHSFLKDGQNSVRLIPVGGPSDVSLVDFIRISYQHSYTADNNALKLTAAGYQQITVDGFTSDRVRVVDVTDPDSPQEIIGAVEKQNAGYAISFATTESGDRSLLAFTTAERPASLALNRSSNLRSGRADFIIITRSDFAESLKPLVTLRKAQGLSVTLVDIEDIYDEFSFGQKSPYAVRDFLAFAHSTWKKKPRFVLFAGDACYDTRNYLGLGDLDLVPTKLIDTYYMETASDDWFADFLSDGVPEIATGRLPARTAEEAVRMIQKIVSYDSSTPSEEILLSADANDGYDFEADSNQLMSLVPTSIRVTQVNRGRVGTETAKQNLLDGIHRGQKLVNHTGHGSVDQWRGNLLTSDDALALRNDRLPVFVMMTCLNAYFNDPVLDSLAESLLKAERGGAVAAWASSGMTLPMDQALMNQELYRQLFNSPRAITLGEAMIRAKSSITDSDIRRTWILLGDPAMKLK